MNSPVTKLLANNAHSRRVYQGSDLLHLQNARKEGSEGLDMRKWENIQHCVSSRRTHSGQNPNTYIVHEQAMIQRLVTIMQILQVQVFRSVVRARSQMLHASQNLAFESSYGRRNQAADAQTITLTVRERQRFVPQRIVQDINSAFLGSERLWILLAHSHTANIGLCDAHDFVYLCT